MNKKCSKCNNIKSFEDFHKQTSSKDGFRSHCKMCIKEKTIKDYSKNKSKILRQKKQYYLDNVEVIKEKREKYVSLNSEKVKSRTYLSYHKNKNKYKKTQKKYREENKTKIREIQNKIAKNNYSTDPTYKLKIRVKNMVYYAFKNTSTIKNTRTHEILGCSYDEFKTHIESQFESWMNWDNHGLYNGQLNYGWDIDHIIPISTSKTYDDVIRLNHYTNLQPLCSFTNRFIKKNNLIIIK